MERITLVDETRQQGMLDALGLQNSENDFHIIIGCGGIGFWLGVFLVMLGARDIVAMDGDKIDYTNLSRLPIPQTWVGLNKAVALRKMIRSLRPDVIATIFTTHITPDTLNLLEQFCIKRHKNHYYTATTTVWDTTDDARIQGRINEYVAKLSRQYNVNVEYRKIGYEGFNIGAYKEYQVWTQDNYETGYRTTQANAISSALAAGIGMFARYLTDKDVNINLKELIKGGGTVCRTTRKKKSGTRETIATS